MAVDRKHWNGKGVHVADLPPRHDNRSVEIGLTPDAARELMLGLGRLRQTTFPLTPQMEELYTALSYVVGDRPFAVEAHRQMQISKGMEPSGG